MNPLIAGALRIHGYGDRFSVKAGDLIRFMISAEGTDFVSARLVRLIHGDQNPQGPGVVEHEIESVLDGEWPVERQIVGKGNYLTVEDPKAILEASGAFTIYAFVWPTAPHSGRQAILSRRRGRGYALAIDDGRLAFTTAGRSSETTLHLPVRVEAKTWFLVAASADPETGKATLRQKPVINRWNSLHARTVPWDLDCERTSDFGTVDPGGLARRFLVGAEDGPDGEPTAFYNGKIDRFGLARGVLSDDELDHLALTGNAPGGKTLAHWDPTIGYTEAGIGSIVSDLGPHALHAVGVNRPVRGQTGWNWGGRNDSFRLAPVEYGGVEFHDDALSDCKWKPSIEFDVPVSLRPGVYALKLMAANESDRAEEYIPFCVRRKQPTAPICLILPTASYLAYANAQTAFDGDLAEAGDKVMPILQETDVAMYERQAPFGLSMYDQHNDGSGVCHSSQRRPIFNMRPGYRMPANAAPWQFAADLSIVGWLEHENYDYEVLTDHDLHAEGAAALKPYRVVLTGTHCEYTSEKMLDAVDDYLADGGRLLYLAGNGYYWVVGFYPDEPWIMEVRRLEAGARAWQARPGEHYLASTGERGGLWRNRGRPPQKLVGTGFSAEGMDVCVSYRRLEASYTSPVAWIFEDVVADLIGDFGLAKGGAAGLEVDRYDRHLGTPPHTVILAHSSELSDNYQLTQEDVMSTLPGLGGSENSLVRADMTYFTTSNHGAVFSASSIAWGSALPVNNFDNNVAQIMRNVVNQFLNDGALPGFDWMIGRLKLS